MRRGLILLAFLMLPATVSAQTAATYAQRATFSQSAAWLGRVSMACVVGAIAVINEDPATANHATRVKLSAAVLKEPEFIARRLAVVLAAAAPVVATTAGDPPVTTVDTTLTDAQLQALVDARWTAFATALVTQ